MLSLPTGRRAQLRELYDVNQLPKNQGDLNTRWEKQFIYLRSRLESASPPHKNYWLNAAHAIVNLGG